MYHKRLNLYAYYMYTEQCCILPFEEEEEEEKIIKNNIK